MATKEISLLLDLDAKKSPSIDKLKSDLTALEKKAEEGKKAIRGLLLIDGEGSASVKRARKNLETIEQQIKDIHAEAKKQVLAKSMKAAAEQAILETRLPDRPLYTAAILAFESLGKCRGRLCPVGINL